ncbi:cytochrome P450 [Paenibacillus alvei]|nr:cytochrome P450 [Paenibacillus alvei]
MEEWQVEQYKPFVEGIRACIGRDLTKDELSTIAWLSGSEQSTIANIMGLIKSANLHSNAHK